MSFVDWALAVHVLSAFAYVAGLVLFWVLIVAVRRVDTPEETLRMEPIVKVGNVAVGLGAVGTIVIGIYLAFAVDSYAIWDGWIIAALVLWAVAGALGQRTGYAAFAVAVVAFAVGATTGLSDAVVVVVIGALALGSLLLAPAIVLGYAVRAAERDDRERGR